MSDQETLKAWLGERVRALLDSRLPDLVDVLGAQIARWLAEEPEQVELDYTWSDAGVRSYNGQSLRFALGPDATVADFLDAGTTDDGTYSGDFVTWRDRLAKQYEDCLAGRMAQALLTDLCDPKKPGPADWETPHRAPGTASVAPSDSLISWVGRDAGWHIGVEIEVVLDIDCFRHPLAVLEAMTLSQVMERWGDVAEADVAVERAEAECRSWATEAGYARRRQVVARWMPRFRLATGDRKKDFVRGDLGAVREAFGRIGLTGMDRWDFIMGAHLWTGALRDALLRADDRGR